jgi:hypothetical protein
MISHKQPEAYTMDRVDTLICWVLREEFADARPSAEVWDDIYRAVQRGAARNTSLWSALSNLWTCIWLSPGHPDGFFVYPCHHAYELHMLLLRQHPMNTRLVC